MPRDNDTSLRAAADRINQSGLVNDVVSTNGRDPSQRERGKSARNDDRQANERLVRDDDTFGNGHDEPVEEEDDDEAETDDSSNQSDEHDADGEPDENGDSDDGEAETAEGDEPEPKEATHKVKIQGKTFEVTTSELVAGYQRGKDYQLKTQKLASTARDFQAGHAKVAEQYQRNLVKLKGVNEGLVKLLVGDINSAAMQQLRDTDPQAYYTQRLKYQDTVDRVKQVIDGLNNESERHLAEVEGLRSGDTQKLIGIEREKLVRAIPDWDGDGTAENPGTKVKVQEFLGSLGFTPQELNTVYDARMLIVADMARRYVEAAKRRQQPVKQKQKTPPKIARPGATQIRKSGQQSAQQQSSFRKAKDIAKKSGSMRDAGNAIKHLL